MVPICVYLNGRCNLLSTFNLSNGERVERLISGLKGVPLFHLKVKNNLETRNYFKENRPKNVENNSELLQITSNDFNFDDLDSERDFKEFDKVSDFIRPDIVSLVSRLKNGEVLSEEINKNYQDYIILDKLKPNIANSLLGESLDVICRPSVGKGTDNASYSHVGTVSYKFIEDQSKVDEVFNETLQNLKNERASKGLKPLEESEENEFKKSFQFLDAKRVYSVDQRGVANYINLKIESVGNLLPCQIFHNAIRLISWKLMDIMTCYDIVMNETLEIVYHNDKITVKKSDTKMDGYELYIKGETHTLGNLLSYHLQSDYQLGDNNLFDFVSYSQPHPLENNIRILFKFNQSFDCDTFLEQLVDIDKLKITSKKILKKS